MALPKGRQQTETLNALDATEGAAYLTGSDVLLRLPAIQRKLDTEAGLNTKGYVSGYPGSPLSGLDSLLRREKTRLSEVGVEFEPGINEELAATSIWGTQNLNLGGNHSDYDGVFGMWYAKGPGVERAADALRTASYFGTSQFGGAIALAGDDHEARSTVTAQQSEPLFVHMGIPVLSPSTLQEFITFGLLGWALSRYSKMWVGMICLNDLADAAASVDLGALPTIVPPGGDGAPPAQLGKGPLAIEYDIKRWRLPAVQKFAEANKLDWVGLNDGPNRKIGIVVGGKAYLDVLDALAQLGVTEERARELGVTVYKLGLIWPIAEKGALEFMSGLDEVVVVEAKHPVIEDQLNRLVNRLPRESRPLIVGKTDEHGARLVPEISGLDSGIVADVLRRRLKRLGVEEPAPAAPGVRQLLSLTPVQGGLVRAAGFCSGCPHNTSTRVPEGSFNFGGTGCHAMATFADMDGRETEMLPQMGGEGAMWIGMSRFSSEQHAFQNVGDGTYSHSASLAIRAAIAADVNITFKILLNGFISMTGGQAIPGGLSAADVARQVLAEGAKKVVVVTENPKRVRLSGKLPRGVQIRHRKKFIQTETELSTESGVSVLIYDQECAAELRRHRKRGTAEDPDKRTYINPAVCEGCGDCNAVSNCISVEPYETSLGRKRKIDQSSCNKDFSCVDGYCPSFVTVYGAKPRVRTVDGKSLDSLPAAPEPLSFSGAEEVYNVVIGGIGGGGVLTIGALLGRAAHIEGQFASVLNETGMAQKNGGVQSHVRITAQMDAELSPRIGPKSADLVIGGDIVLASSAALLGLYDSARTKAIVNEEVKATVAFAENPNLDLAGGHMASVLREATDDHVDFVDANGLAVALFGDEIYSNIILLGHAAQRGQLPVKVASLEEAIELNGVSVKKNLQALHIGRLLAVDISALDGLLANSGESPETGDPVTDPTADADLDSLIADRIERLTGYQNRKYAERYVAFVNRVRSADIDSDEALTRAVAKYLYKLMAYKDEYEVGRLYSEPEFRRRLKDEFEGNFRIKANLAPQLFNTRDSISGRARKWEIPFWLAGPSFRALASMKRVRGTRLDLFGATEHRKAERARIGEYEAMIGTLIGEINDVNYDVAVQIASVPEFIRGYDSVKDLSAEDAERRLLELQSEFRTREPATA
ncbi:indolepyruvate ferredoxin oxidoreductase [Rhodococcus sp. 27YEA15]|uniref:indolepyruvate ferredoxin oxidoreductase family protein n=1 Tax=Rhodococcus sp. 27YEA15 TaxID=3156259 RepID=UPI003C7CC198